VERDARVLGERELSRLERRLADESPEQRRLAGPVRPGERQTVSPAQAKRHPVEEGIAGELLAQPGRDEDGHGGRIAEIRGHASANASRAATIGRLTSAGGDWGEMRREGFTTVAEAPLPE
jgi:hypothetical protein